MKAWGRVGENLTLNRWFKEEVRYTLLSAANITGLIPESCFLKYRNGSEASKTGEGASGTVDQDSFADWVEFFLCPQLGEVRFNAPNSIVILDNASVHFSPRVVQLIEAYGAYVLFLSPFSPDFNPIEKMFHIYKAKLKRVRFNNFF